MLLMVSGSVLVLPSGTWPRSIIVGETVSCGGVSALPAIGTCSTPLSVVTSSSSLCFMVERGV